jgi:hypothetical protein
MQPKPRSPSIRKGAGIGAAIFTMFIVSPLLIFFIKAVGAVIAIGFVIYFCVVDKKVHWAWRLLAALVLVGLITSQYQLVARR